MAEKIISFEKPLDYTQILFDCIRDCTKAESLGDYIHKVENLCDFLAPYWKRDKRFLEEVKVDGRLLTDMSNPWFNERDPEEQKDYSRKVFRALIELIHRSGFMPLKEFFEVWE